MEGCDSGRDVVVLAGSDGRGRAGSILVTAAEALLVGLSGISCNASPVLIQAKYVDVANASDPLLIYDVLDTMEDSPQAKCANLNVTC
jgi:hypothetical protein